MSVPAGTSRTLYFDAQEAFSLGVTILACGHDYHRRILAPDDRWKMRSHGLVIVLDGAGFFLSESHPHTRFAGGDAFFLFPEEEHAYSPDPGTIMEDYWFRMDGILLASLTKQRILRRRHPFFRGAVNGNLLAVLRQMRAILEDDTSDKKALPGILLQVMSDILSSSEPSREAEPQSDHGVFGVMEAIRAAPAKNQDLQSMADRIGMTYSRLRKEFTRKLGVPPRQFVNRERMHLACNLLEGGALAKEACFAIGMKDVGHFSKLFKRIVGMGPKEFARSGERRG